MKLYALGHFYVTYIQSSVDAGHPSLLGLLDQSNCSAFDVIDHEILLDRLRHSFGFSGMVYWIGWSLNLTGVSSTISHLVCGVPQGSVMGPLFSYGIGYIRTHLTCWRPRFQRPHLCLLYADLWPHEYQRSTTTRSPFFQIVSMMSKIGWKGIDWDWMLQRQRWYG